MTDHRPLIYLFNMTNPSSRLTKFRLTLEEYDFDIEYIRGRDNVTADALSRVMLPSSELKEMNSNIEKNMYVMTRAQTRQLPHEDEILDNRTSQPDVLEISLNLKGQ